MTTAQLPSGATMVNTTRCCTGDGLLSYKEKENQLASTVGGFGFSGQGKTMALAFISLKPWSERVGEEKTRLPRSFSGQ